MPVADPADQLFVIFATEFHQYANKLIAELKSINNDPTPVVKKLEEIEETARARQRYANMDGSNVDTFDRLGFEPTKRGSGSGSGHLSPL